MKNITRYTYERHRFQGWRVAFYRKNNAFVKYFSDCKYGSEEASLQAAIELRDKISEQLALCPENSRGVFKMFREEENN